jgi:hypothetical protein
MKKFARARGPAAPHAVIVEDKANGPPSSTTLNKADPGFIAINPEGGKVARANAVTPLYEAGNVFHPDPSIVVPWDRVGRPRGRAPEVPEGEERRLRGCRDASAQLPAEQGDGSSAPRWIASRRPAFPGCSDLSSWPRSIRLDRN